MRPKAIFAMICVVVLSAGTAFASPLPISEVVKMGGSGARPQDVIQRLRASQTSYALRGSDFGKLKAAGVSDEVLDYLQQSFVSNVDQLTRYSVIGPRLGGCSYCYPQPVDLDRMVFRLRRREQRCAWTPSSRSSSGRTRLGFAQHERRLSEGSAVGGQRRRLVRQRVWRKRLSDCTRLTKAA